MANISKPTDINKIWAASGDVLAPSDTKISQGWQVEIPPRQYFNYIDGKQDQAIAHINQHGIAVWDSLTEYQSGASYVQGSNGKIYKAVTTNTNINPVLDSGVNWSVFRASGSLIAIRTYLTSGTYTPTAGTSFVIVDVQAGGGGGGGSPAGTASAVGIGSGGHSGARAVGRFDSGFSGVSITVGAGGSAGASTPGAIAGVGGNSSFGGLISASGGPGGASLGPTPGPTIIGNSQNLPSSTGGNILGMSGNSGAPAIVLNSAGAISGVGGFSVYGGSSLGLNGTGAGNPANQWGSGGSGAFSATSAPAQVGGVGGGGVVFVYEYA